MQICRLCAEQCCTKVTLLKVRTFPKKIMLSSIFQNKTRKIFSNFLPGRHFIMLKVQCHLDLVTLLVTAKTVTKFNITKSRLCYNFKRFNLVSYVMKTHYEKKSTKLV